MHCGEQRRLMLPLASEMAQPDNQQVKIIEQGEQTYVIQSAYKTKQTRSCVFFLRHLSFVSTVISFIPVSSVISWSSVVSLMFL